MLADEQALRLVSMPLAARARIVPTDSRDSARPARSVEAKKVVKRFGPMMRHGGKDDTFTDREDSCISIHHLRRVNVLA